MPIPSTEVSSGWTQRQSRILYKLWA